MATYLFTVPGILLKAEVFASSRNCIVTDSLLNPMEKLQLQAFEEDILIRGRKSGKGNCMVMVDKKG
jgi:hypothetical protein